MNIVILDGHAVNPGDLSWKPFEQFGKIAVYPRTPQSLIVERAMEADAVLINKTVLSGDILEQLPRLQYIGICATGYNVVDIAYAKSHGITVCNVPGYSTNSVAQHVFALLLNITNRVEHYAQANIKGKWSQSEDFCYWDYPIRELFGKTLGIYGLGNIGQAVARIGYALGMSVIAYTSKQSSDVPAYVRKVSLADLLSQSDVLTLHCPLTETTFHLVNEETLRKMKHTAILVNTARGNLVDEKAVADSLIKNELGAFAADVLSTEPPSIGNPLFSAPNVFITPHIAWATLEARKRLMDICVQNLSAFVSGIPENQISD